MTSLFDGLRPPSPDPALRARALAAAEIAVAERRALADRLWESRAFWATAAATIVLLVAANSALAPAPLPHHPRSIVVVEGIAIPAPDGPGLVSLPQDLPR